MSISYDVRANRKKYAVLIAGVILQFCAGIIYMWSVFKKPVADYLDWTSSASALTASFMLVAFVAGILIGGRLMDRIGPKNVCVIGSLTMSLGILASSLVTPSYPQIIYLTYGVIGGFGVGTIYTCTVSSIQKWFYDRRGFATGLMVGAFGFSLVLFAPLANALLSGIGVPYTFAAFGIAFLIICISASLFISNPPKDYVIAKATSASSQKQYTTKEMLRTKSFYLITMSLFLILPAYFILNPLFMSLGEARGLSESLAVMGVMITGVCSASGRLFITWISDHIGRMASLLMIIGFTLIGSIVVIFAENILFVICLALVAFGFGGAAGIYATVTSDHFGTKNMGSNYGFVMIGFGASALIFPLLSTNIASDGDYTMSFAICSVTCIASLLCILILRKFSDAGVKEENL